MRIIGLGVSNHRQPAALVLSTVSLGSSNKPQHSKLLLFISMSGGVIYKKTCVYAF